MVKLYHIISLLTSTKCQKEAFFVFINKSSHGDNNICGKKVSHYRKLLQKSQRELADTLQLLGLDVDKNAIQRIEAGKRFVTDIEIVFLCKALNVTIEELLDMS